MTGISICHALLQSEEWQGLCIITHPFLLYALGFTWFRDKQGYGTKTVLGLADQVTA